MQAKFREIAKDRIADKREQDRKKREEHRKERRNSRVQQSRHPNGEFQDATVTRQPGAESHADRKSSAQLISPAALARRKSQNQVKPAERTSSSKSDLASIPASPPSINLRDVPTTKPVQMARTLQRDNSEILTADELREATVTQPKSADELAPVPPRHSKAIRPRTPQSSLGEPTAPDAHAGALAGLQINMEEVRSELVDTREDISDLKLQLELFDKRFDKVYSLVKDLHSLSNSGTLSKRGASLRAGRSNGLDRVDSSIAEETLEREIAQMEEEAEADLESDEDENDEEKDAVQGELLVETMMAEAEAEAETTGAAR